MQGPKPKNSGLPTMRQIFKEFLNGIISSVIARLIVSGIMVAFVVLLTLYVLLVPSARQGVQSMLDLFQGHLPAPRELPAGKSVSPEYFGVRAVKAASPEELARTSAENAFTAAGIAANQQTDTTTVDAAYRLAIEKADSAIALNPVQPRPYQIAAYSCFQIASHKRDDQRQLRESGIRYLEKAEQLCAPHPLDGLSCFCLASAYQLNGKSDHAKLRYHQAIDVWHSKRSVDLTTDERKYLHLAEIRLGKLH